MVTGLQSHVWSGLVNKWPKESCFLVCLVLVPNLEIFQLEEIEGGISFCHMYGIDFSRGLWVIIHFMPSLAKYARKGVTLGHHQHTGSQKSWSNSPKSRVNWVKVHICALYRHGEAVVTKKMIFVEIASVNTATTIDCPKIVVVFIEILHWVSHAKSKYASFSTQIIYEYPALPCLVC